MTGANGSGGWQTRMLEEEGAELGDAVSACVFGVGDRAVQQPLRGVLAAAAPRARRREEIEAPPPHRLHGGRQGFIIQLCV